MIKVKDAIRRQDSFDSGAELCGFCIGNSLLHLEEKVSESGELLGGKQHGPDKEKQPKGEAHRCSGKGGPLCSEKAFLPPEAFGVKPAELSGRTLLFRPLTDDTMKVVLSRSAGGMQ